jgi:hypothetical protein
MIKMGQFLIGFRNIDLAKMAMGRVKYHYYYKGFVSAIPRGNAITEMYILLKVL